MRKTYVYIISLLFALSWIPVAGQKSELPDTVEIPLKFRIGLEVTGPVIYFTNKDNLNYEGYISADINEKNTVYLGGGYSDYKYSQYNYSFHSNGIYFKAGIDFNLMKPEKSVGKYWAGIGIHYGISSFASEIPSFQHDNYWGTTTSSVGQRSSLGHFFELAPGFRADIFKYFTIGWSVSLKKLLYSGTSKDLKPVYLPGYGNATKSVSPGINYFIILNVPFKKIKVVIEPEPVEEPIEE